MPANQTLEHYIRELVLITVEMDQIKKNADRLKKIISEHPDLKEPGLFVVSWKPPESPIQEFILQVTPSTTDEGGWEVYLTKAKRI